MVVGCLVLKERPMFSLVVALFYIATNNVWGTQCLSSMHPHQHLAFYFVKKSTLISVIYVIKCISLMANNVQHIFIHYLHSEYSLFEMFLFLLNSLYILVVSLSCQICALKIFFSVSSLLYYLFKWSFTEKNIKFDEIQFMNLFFWYPAYDVKSKNSLPSTTTPLLLPIFFPTILYTYVLYLSLLSILRVFFKITCET